MDFALSPDWPALWCYFIVLVIGFFGASFQVERLFQGFPQAWIMFSTWVLFAIFLLLPVGLFWVLDRTNTLHDTSLFGAILVAVAYRQVLAGGVERVNVPGQASRIWDRLLKWVDERAATVRKRMERNADSFDQKVIAHLTDHPETLDKVLRLLKFHSADFSKIDQDFNASQEKWRPLGDDILKLKTADFLYRQLRLVTKDSFTDLMYQEGITTWQEYYWYGKEWRSRLVQVLVIGALVAGSGWLFYKAVLDPAPTFGAPYYLSRLKKVNATPEDRARTRRELGALIEDENNEAGRAYLCDSLTATLRYDTMPVETGERILAVLLERRSKICKGEQQLAQLLVEALRAENPDVRLRIEDAVLFLARQQGRTVEPALDRWQPAKNDSATDIEDRIRKWRAFWDQGGAQAGRDAGPPKE